MSDVVAAALKFAAGIILAVVLVAVGIMVFTPAADSAKTVTTDFAANTTELKDQKYLIYDNTVVSGSQVLSALRKFETEGKARNLAINVKTGKNPAGTWYYSQFVSGTTELATSAIQNLERAVNTTHYDYINPAGMFDSKIERDRNGVIRAVHFTQQVRN